MNEIGLYVHIPFCMKKCEYCDFLSGVYDEQIQKQYTVSLCEEIKYMGQRLQGTAVSSIYIGGGTPTWLDQEYMESILQTLQHSFHILESAEVSMECNPGTVTFEKLKSYHLHGVNRLSIGLQSANEKELQCLGRVHTFERFLHTFDMARKSNFYNINVDVMTGLPGQKLDDLMHTLLQVISLRPEHISAYALMVEEGTPFYDRYKFDVIKQKSGMETEFLPNEDEEYQQYKMTQQVLHEHGYTQYEISNYARPGYECEHNISYWIRKPYLGLGLGAASLLGNVRAGNVRGIDEYIKRSELLPTYDGENLSPFWEGVQWLSRFEEMEEFMFLGLRMNRGVTREDFRRCFGCNVEGIYGPQIKKLKEEGLLQMEEGRIFLTERGMDLSNYALAEFIMDREK